MKNIKNFYATHTIGKIIASILALLVVSILIYMIPVWQIKENIIECTITHACEPGQEIGLDAGEKILAQNNGMTLKIDTESMTVNVVNDKTGEVYSSAVEGAASGQELALLSVSYLGKDNNIKEWNSYDNCVAFSTYKLYEIENGVQIVLNLNEGESNRFYEYLPKKMSIERYEETFLAGLKQLAQDGKLDEKKAKRYQQTLSLVYKKSIMENCYAVTYTGTPPATAVNQMIEIAKLVGYTQEMLLEDADEFEFTVTFSEAPIMDITVDITLDNGELVVSMPAADMVSENDFYSIQNIKLLPNFGAVTSGSYKEGYILVPDGAGALIAFDSYQANIKNYERVLYDNDFFTDYQYMPEYAEELFMPVYGMLYGALENTEKGFLAIVEEGARNGSIQVRLASKSGDSAKYNKVYAAFDIDAYKKVKINGEYSEDTASYLVNTGMQDIECKVRYQFFGKKQTYFDMAKSYQDYLVRQTGMEKTYDSGEAMIYLEAIGALTIDKRMLGIPYQSIYSMTTYNELLEIMQDLEDINIQVQYDGVINGGMNNKLSNKAELVVQNGSKKEWKNLQAYIKELDIPMYTALSLAKVGADGNGYMPSRHAVRDFANEEAEIYRYTPAVGIKTGVFYGIPSGEPYTYIAPSWLSDVTQKFLSESENLEGLDTLAITDIAGMYYADYRFHDFVIGQAADKVLNESLTQLAKNKTLALTNPHIDKIQYGTIATDISRNSSEYTTFTYTIPFKQLVMNGLIDYTTTDVNMSSKDSDYYVLQAAELGAIPKYKVTAKNVGVLKETAYQYLYATEYELFADEIKQVYQECADIRSSIGSSEIIGHSIIKDGVYKTTYANGTQVYVNYNLYDVQLSDGAVISSQKYLIKEGK